MKIHYFNPDTDLALACNGGHYIAPEQVRGMMRDLAVATNHSTAADAAKCALEAGAGNLLLGHYSSRYKSTEPFLKEARSIFPETFLAKDLDIVELPLVKA